jgi:ligand-binding sensor domain-containing protein
LFSPQFSGAYAALVLMGKPTISRILRPKVDCRNRKYLPCFKEKRGEMWMGTNAGGVNRYNGRGFTYLNKDNGLIDNTVFAFARDKGGRILIGTNKGITVLDGIRKDTVTVAEGLSHEGIHSLLVASDGTIWVGTRKGACTLKGLKATPFDVDSSLSNSTVLNIREGTDGSIWFCTVQNGLIRYDNGRVYHYTMENGLLRNYVFDVMPLSNGRGWIFGYDGLYHIHGAKAVIQTVDVVPTGTTFYAVLRDRSNNIWLGHIARGAQIQKQQIHPAEQVEWACGQ